MSLYKNKLNTRTGQFNLVPSNAVISFKSSVTSEENLPTEGNEENDARIVNDTHLLYVWDGSSWIDQGDILDITWAAISGKPSSAVVDIDDAVSKKHSHSNKTLLDTYSQTEEDLANAVGLKADIVYYINPESGDDENDGLSSGTAFATIQHAIDLLPKNLGNHTATINLADSLLYTERPVIQGFYGGTLEMYGSDASNVLFTVNGAFEINSNSAFIWIGYFSIKITSSGSSCIWISNSKLVQLDTIKFCSDGIATLTKGIGATNVSSIAIYNISDYDSNKVSIGILSDDSIITVMDESSLGDTFIQTTQGGIVITNNKIQGVNFHTLDVDEDGNTEIQGFINLPNDQVIKFGGDIFIKRWETNKAIAIGKLTGADKLYSYYFGDEAGLNNTGDRIISIGYEAGKGNTENNCIFIGDRAGLNNTGRDSVFIGNRAGQDSTAKWVSLVGQEAGFRNTGEDLTAIGAFAAAENTGIDCVAVGFESMINNIGDNTVGVGYHAGYNNTANDCIFIGYEAGAGNSAINQFIVKQNNVNATPLIQGDFSTGHIDLAGELKIKVYSQDDEPTLSADQRCAYWIDTNDSDKVYLVFRRGTGDQVKIELT